MVSSVNLPISDYLSTAANQANLMASFQKTPDYTQAVANYQSQIGSIANVDQFLGNYKVLQFALSAYGLDSAISETGFLKQALSEDPTQSTSLVQQEGNPQLIAFAKAYWSLSTSNPTVASPTSVDAVTAKYTQVQFGQWVSDNDQDPTLATALSAQQTLQDSVDVSNVGALFAQYQKAPATQDAVNYYQAHIQDVTSPADLTADPKLLDVALTAYGIDPATISTDTVTQLLTQDPTDANSVAFNNPSYGAFAAAFASLQTDGGVGVSQSSAIGATVTNYQTASFQAALATNDDAANTALFGAAGAKQIDTLKADFQNESGVSIAASYFTANAQNAKTVADFVADPKLLDIALTAYGLSPTTIDSSTAQLLLTQDPTSSTSLAAQSITDQPFVSALQPAFAATANGISSTTASAIAAQFEQTMFRASIGGDLTQAQAQTSTNSTEDVAAGAPLTDYQIIANTDLAGVVYGAYNQPASLGALDPDQQVQALTRAGFDPSALSAPNDITQLVEKYLVSAGDQNNAAATDPILTLFQSSDADSSGIISLDTSLLYGGGGESSDASGSILSLIT